MNKMIKILLSYVVSLFILFGALGYACDVSIEALPREVRGLAVWDTRVNTQKEQVAFVGKSYAMQLRLFPGVRNLGLGGTTRTELIYIAEHYATEKRVFLFLTLLDFSPDWNRHPLRRVITNKVYRKFYLHRMAFLARLGMYSSSVEWESCPAEEVDAIREATSARWGREGCRRAG